MGQIRYTAEVSALTGRSNSPMQSQRVDANAFGANVGEAMQDVGRTAGALGETAFNIGMKEKEREQKQSAANYVAMADWASRELELRNTVGPDSDEYQSLVREGYINYVDEYTNGIEDDMVRMSVRNTMMADLPTISARSAQYEFSAKADYSKAQTDEALNSLQNKINLDPTQYDKFRGEGDAIIDALPNTTAALREGMKTTWKYNSAKRRFDGMINTVKTIDDIDNISLELAGGEGMRDWQSEMLPTDYEGLMNTLGSMRKSFNDSHNTNARAVLSSMEERTNSDPILLPIDELKAMQEAVALTTDRAIQSRAARLMDAQEIIRRNQRLPVSELRAMKNAMMGNPGLAYPDLPVEVSNAVNKAAETFGVSAGLLGAMANREYGSEFAKAKKKKDASTEPFKPLPAHKGIDVRNMRSDILDAVTLAGVAYGGPLTLTASSGGVTTPESGVNIVTVGMDGEEKAKIAAALVDAGFTGISEYDGYLQADMRHAVSSTFGEKDGKVWGGWTYLSPEVATVLKEKGFKGGAEASSISRNQIGEPKTAVNYAAPTSIVDETGRPTSTAMGLFQFTEDTWLQTIKDPDVAAILGVDLVQTDEALLALRGNEELSTMAAAAYAKANERKLSNVLGRPVNDAEIYMAHFMGPRGASTFLTAHKNNPEQLADELMPRAAASNKPVFYADKGKGAALTVGEVYDNIASSFTLAPSKVTYERTQTLDAMIKAQEKRLAEEPMQQAIISGSHVVTPITDDASFVSRGAQSRAVADYYGIPMEDMKPFTKEEEALIKKTISAGTTDQNLALMANIQRMGEEPAKAALKQIGQTDGTFAHSASLYLQGSPVVAGDIVRGRKRIEENPSVVDQIGATKTELSDAFTNATGAALYDVNPAYRQSIQEASTALYVERMARSGGSISRFDRAVYEQAVQDTMGAQPGYPAIGDVNGNPTVMPQGVRDVELEDALIRMTVDDWTKMSGTGEPPRYPDGGIVDVTDIRDEVMLRAIGNGEYLVMLDDGSMLTTGKRTPDGRWEGYIFKPNAAEIKKINGRPGPNLAAARDFPAGIGVQ